MGGGGLVLVVVLLVCVCVRGRKVPGMGKYETAVNQRKIFVSRSLPFCFSVSFKAVLCEHGKGAKYSDAWKNETNNEKKKRLPNGGNISIHSPKGREMEIAPAFSFSDNVPFKNVNRYMMIGVCGASGLMSCVLERIIHRDPQDENIAVRRQEIRKWKARSKVMDKYW